MEVYNSCNNHTPEIVFFDLETTVPNKGGQRFWVLEFGAIVVNAHKLSEIESYSTLIKPKDLSVVSLKSSRIDGITRKAVENAPSFEDLADKIFSILNGRVWAGHNIQRFDCVRIKEAFEDINRPAPQPVGIIDSLGVLTDKFGRRAGNMKMATLASYFGLGQQKHRSLDDVRMNLEVLKHCATVLFLSTRHIAWKTQMAWLIQHYDTEQNKWEIAMQRRDEQKISPNFIFISRNGPLWKGKFGKGDRKNEGTSTTTIETFSFAVKVKKSCPR